MKTVTTIELTVAYLKVIQVKAEQKAGLLYGAAVPVSGLSDEQIGAKLGELCRHRPALCKNTTLIAVLPRQNAVVRDLRLPSKDRQELARMVDLQAGNHIPYSREDVVIDFLPLTVDEEGYSTVAMMAMPQDSIVRVWQVCKAAKLTPDLVTVSSVGIWQWMNQRSLAKEPLAVLDVDEGVSEFVLADKDRLWMSRQIPLGAGDLARLEFEGFFKQVRLTLESYQKEKTGPLPAKMIICSALPQAEEFRAAMETEFGISVEVLSPVDRSAVDKKTAWPKLALSGEISLTALLGTAISSLPLPMDFIPPAIKEERAASARTRRFLRLGALFVLALAVVGAALNLNSIVGNTRLNSLNSEIKKSKKQVSAVEAKMAEVQLLKDALSGRHYFVDVVDELYKVLPEDIILLNLSLSGGQALSLQGTTAQASSINRLQAAMVEAKVFDNVSLEYVNKRTTQAGETNYFKINCTVSLRGQ